MAKHDRICVCCGAKYQYCSQCDAYKNQPLWKYAFDKIECVKTFEILTAYGTNQVTKLEAKAELEKINIYPEDVINSESRKQMDEIFKEDKKIAVEEQKVENKTKNKVPKIQPTKRRQAKQSIINND